ncbi:MAG TPA: flotillin family protein [Drouetiella sp.]
MSISLMIFAVGLLLSMIMLAVLITSTYRKCGPNQAMIISGMAAGEGENSFKIVVGGGAVVLPLIQQANILSLEVLKIDVAGQTPFITRDGASVRLDAVGQIKVKGDTISIATACEQLLNKTGQEIVEIGHDIFLGHMRDVIGTLTFEELNGNLSSVAQRVQEAAISDLAKMGMTVVSFTFKELSRCA